MIILGLNAYHADSAACLVRDGILVAAAEEERFRRIKHWAGLPTEAIAWCLREAGIGLDRVDAIAINQDGRAHWPRKLATLAAHPPSPRLVLDRLRTRRARAGVVERLAAAFPGTRFSGRLHAVEHHRAHLSSAFHVSPFAEAAAVSVDGFGDFASTAWGVGRGASLSVEGRVFFPHSLGLFYQAVTQHLGFPHYGDEYKVMGLAPYGGPGLVPVLRRLLHLRADGGFALDLAYFRHHREPVPMRWTDGVPDCPRLSTPALDELLGPARRPDEPLTQTHKDIAHAAQAVYEEAFFHLLDAVQARTGLTDLALAGGCAANSVANGKVRRRTRFRRVFVQAAAGDAGGALGAAYAVWHERQPQRRFVMDHAAWGPEATEAEVAALLAARGADLAAEGCRVGRIADEAALCRMTAAAVADGAVVGWFQGRMEWGPRALGNRSIVGDPRRADMKDILNRKIKRRESFRPFAPSVLAEAAGTWFEEDDAVPFMMQVFQVREEKRALVPAVTHVDGSGRLQTVTATANPRYHRLIAAFRDLTGVPLVLNTSFNENEPIVCRPDEALDCFLRTRMDLLVIGDHTIARGAAGGGAA
ncbi:carbamoyltransferase [Methylobacterium sp. 174MFSha1.1]|uniref:carbamoyltransferase family protein n=1 Tax=Methylobacterium sp. 174MFSha1.1 TaxID=1502749 RepID=UPI0008EDDFCE|nr:carbamoyltransferase C-terminal domain-containing protein [Methylobacterium sp. 174MFSha1.1]SFU47251.1 carbamoyltransferase [Methylobacterium sp. 174MFSha1.1]